MLRDMATDGILTDGVRITYLYRDADNYKFYDSFCLVGVIKITDFEDYLFDKEYFIPSKLGFSDLQPLQKTAADHLLHEVVDLNEELVSVENMTAGDFIRRIKSVNTRGWFND